jgi:heterodisulfide reductase subunit A
MSDEEITETVGTIVVATGMETYDPTEMDEYGYTRFENVLTSLEFERLVNAGGPTKGEILRPTDRKTPKSIGFVQCVGSRSAGKGSAHCSNVCCMNTIKSTLVLKEHCPDMDVKVFYIDIRAFGKGFEDLYKRSRRLGVHYLRGLPGTVEENADQGLRVAVENTALGKIEFFDLDMLVLAVGIQPSDSTRTLQMASPFQRILWAWALIRTVNSSFDGSAKFRTRISSALRTQRLRYSTRNPSDRHWLSCF